MATFMNAFTGSLLESCSRLANSFQPIVSLASDWTMYAFSTQNQKDYFNLMSVYLDAVLHPKLDEYDFM